MRAKPQRGRLGRLERHLRLWFERCDPDVIDRQIAYHLEQQRLVLWQNESGENTSMASCVRESDHGGTISLVYTPPSHRSRGGLSAPMERAKSYNATRLGDSKITRNC